MGQGDPLEEVTDGVTRHSPTRASKSNRVPTPDERTAGSQHEPVWGEKIRQGFRVTRGPCALVVPQHSIDVVRQVDHGLLRRLSLHFEAPLIFVLPFFETMPLHVGPEAERPLMSAAGGLPLS